MSEQDGPDEFYDIDRNPRAKLYLKLPFRQQEGPAKIFGKLRKMHDPKIDPNKAQVTRFNNSDQGEVFLPTDYQALDPKGQERVEEIADFLNKKPSFIEKLKNLLKK